MDLRKISEMYKIRISGLMLILLILIMFFNDFNTWSQSIGLVLPILFIVTYMYQYLKQYLTVEEKVIYLNSPFSKIIEFEKIKFIKKVAGEYILVSDNTELGIDTIIDPESMIYLNMRLKDLNVIF